MIPWQSANDIYDWNLAHAVGYFLDYTVPIPSGPKAGLGLKSMFLMTKDVPQQKIQEQTFQSFVISPLGRASLPKLWSGDRSQNYCYRMAMHGKIAQCLGVVRRTAHSWKP